MSMSPCQHCLENNWEYEHNDGMIKATCQECGNEVEFVAKNAKKRKIDKEGDKCRKCGNPVIKRESKFKKSKLRKAYYYTAYFYCLKCRQRYTSEKFKVIN